MSYRIHLFCSDVILMRFVFSSFWPWSRAFVGINNASVFRLAFPNIAVGFSTALYRYFARHCCWHWNSQLSPSGFRCELEFFAVWFNEEYSSQLSGIVEFWFLDGPSLFCFLFRCIGHKFPHIWSYIIRKRSFLFPCKSPRDHVYPSGGLSFSRTNLVNPVHASDNSLSPSTFQLSSICFSNITSGDVHVVLVTSMYFNGIRNDSSLGTYSLTLGST